MSDDKREVSEVESFEDTTGYDDGDVTPCAEDANQTADGAPKNYGEDAPDSNLPPADLTDDALGDNYDGVAPEEDLPPVTQ